jgi:hypothetical protein
MFRLLGSALVAAALFVIPIGMSTHFSSNQALAEATEKADQSDKGKTAKKKKRELTKGQKSARERQRQCGREWRDAKKAGKVEKGMTWPKYWSACNTRLKGKG